MVDANQCRVDFAVRAEKVFNSNVAAQAFCDQLNAKLGKVCRARGQVALIEDQGTNVNSTFQAGIAAILQLLQDVVPVARRLEFAFKNLNQGTC